MNYLLTILSLVSMATMAGAQDTFFSAPNGAVVQMNAGSCPQNMTCIDAMETGGDADLSLILPDWIDEKILKSQSEDAKAAAYLQGMSDGYIVDICNYCGCCTISLDPVGAGEFVPWETAPKALLLPSPRFEEDY